MPDEVNNVLAQLLAKLDDITDMKVQMGVMSTKMDSMAASQQDLTTAIKGNGKPGLNDRVLALEQTVVPIVEEHKKEKEDREKRKEDSEKEKSGLRSSFIVLTASTILNVVLTVLNLK